MVTWNDKLHSEGETYTLWYSINGENWYVLNRNATTVLVYGSFGYEFKDGTVTVMFKPVRTVGGCRFCLTLADVRFPLGIDLETTDAMVSKIVSVVFS